MIAVHPRPPRRGDRPQSPGRRRLPVAVSLAPHLSRDARRDDRGHRAADQAASRGGLSRQHRHADRGDRGSDPATPASRRSRARSPTTTACRRRSIGRTARTRNFLRKTRADDGDGFSRRDQRPLPSMRLATIDHRRLLHADRPGVRAAVRPLRRARAAGPTTRSIGVYDDDPFSVAEDATALARRPRGRATTFTFEPPLVETIDCAAAATRCCATKAPTRPCARPISGSTARWLAQSGEEVEDAPVFEEYLNNPRDTEPQNLLTEIYLPLKVTAAGRRCEDPTSPYGLRRGKAQRRLVRRSSKSEGGSTSSAREARKQKARHPYRTPPFYLARLPARSWIAPP